MDERGTVSWRGRGEGQLQGDGRSAGEGGEVSWRRRGRAGQTAGPQCESPQYCRCEVRGGEGRGGEGRKRIERTSHITTLAGSAVCVLYLVAILSALQ